MIAAIAHGVSMTIRTVPGDYKTVAEAVAKAAAEDTLLVGSAYAGGESDVDVDKRNLTIGLEASVPELRFQLTPELGDVNLTLTGGGAASLRGNAGANALTGNDGANVLRGDGGNDTLTGGAGLDWADYDNAGGGVTVDLQAGIATGAAGTDTLTGIEGIRGSGFADALSGDEADNTFRGLGGDDVIDGRGGFDYVDYIQATDGVTVDLARSVGTGASEGTDTLIGIENARGSHHDDVLIGTDVENRFRGLGGDDRIDGGGGLDYVDYRDATSLVRVDLGRSIGAGRSEGTDTLRSIEKVIGSVFGDVLTGDRGDNLLRGVGGRDVLTGGRGHDSFVFSAPSDGDGRGDRIMDFVSAKAAADRPRLAEDAILLDADGFGVRDGSLREAGVRLVIDRLPVNGNETLIFDTKKSTLSWDADGTGAARAVVLAVFENDAALSRADFLFI